MSSIERRAANCAYYEGARYALLPSGELYFRKLGGEWTLAEKEKLEELVRLPEEVA